MKMSAVVDVLATLESIERTSWKKPGSRHVTALVMSLVEVRTHSTSSVLMGFMGKSSTCLQPQVFIVSGGMID